MMASFIHISKILIFVVLCHFSHSYNVLVVTPMPVISHAILGNAFVKLLLNEGYKIIHITGIPYNMSHSNLRRLEVNYYHETLPSKGNSRAYGRFIREIFISSLRDNDVSMLLRDTTQKFDLVIAEWMFNDIYAGLSALYDCPLLWFSATESHWMMLRLLEDAVNSQDTAFKHIPPFITSYIMDDMYLYNLEKEAYDNIFGPLMSLRGKSLLRFEESRYFGANTLVYLNVSPGVAKKLPRNFKPIAGYHVDRIVDPLPKKLKSIMDNAKHGVIYFSMGSNLNSQDILHSYNEILMKAFSNLRQVVLWKHEIMLSHLPSNVHILKWAPQQSILSHPNCILFMTQGGALSSIEALHFGVAVLGLPIIADQFTNIERAVDQGYAKLVDLMYSTGEDIKDSIEEMIINPRFRNKAKELSKKYHNQSSPDTELVRYVRKVIRTGVIKYHTTTETMTFKKLLINISMWGLIVLTSLWLILKNSIKLRKSKENLNG